jgi:hypothetical protein
MNSSGTFHFQLCLQEEPDEHGQGKWGGKQESKSDKRITESKAQQKESTTFHFQQRQMALNAISPPFSFSVQRLLIAVYCGARTCGLLTINFI